MRDAPDEDDFFKDTRFWLGDHIEALRKHLWRAIAGLAVCCVLGFILDGIGWALGTKDIGIARPLFVIIEGPVHKAGDEYNDVQDKRFEEEMKKPESPAAALVKPIEVP